MPTGVANLDKTQYVLVSSAPGSFILQSHLDAIRIAVSTSKPARENKAFHEIGENMKQAILPIPYTEESVWALAMTDNSKLTITEQRVPIEISDRGGMGYAVFLQDQTTEMLDLDFLELVKDELTIGVETDPDSRVITLAPGHGMTNLVYPLGDVGTTLEIGSNTSGRFIQALVLAVAGDDVTLNQLVGDAFPIGTSVNTGNRNLALVDGSTTPVIFRVEPSPVQAGDITRVIVVIVGPDSMDFTTFGSDPKLAIGILFRIRRPDGSYKNLRTIDRNLEGSLWGFDADNFAPRTGNSDHAIVFRVTFASQGKHGVAARLDGTLTEQFEAVVLDNLGTLTNTEIRIIAEGSELQE